MFDILNTEAKRFEKLAEIATISYFNDNISLNDSIVKIAEEKDLNPEQIKRVVEAANIKVFQKNLSDEDREGHKDVDFDVADSKVIIKRIFIIKVPKDAKDDKDVSDGSNGSNGTLDFFKDLAMDNFGTHTHEDVDDIVEEKKMDRPTLIIRIKTAKSNLEKEAYATSEQYVEKVAEFARNYRRSDAPKEAFSDLCKEAFDHRGESIRPILESVAKASRKEIPKYEDLTMSKVAGFMSSEVQELLEIEKIAHEYKRYETAVNLAEKKLKEITTGK